jgi:hypothetical protein
MVNWLLFNVGPKVNEGGVGRNNLRAERLRFLPQTRKHPRQERK